MYSLDGRVSLKSINEISFYKELSFKSVEAINRVLNWAKAQNRYKILIDTNLKSGIPMENVNKVAGPFVEAWAYEIFNDYLQSNKDENITKVDSGTRLNIADIIMHIANVDNNVLNTKVQIDVKATSYDILGSGKSPNITSFGRIRSQYLQQDDFVFIILSIKHRVYSKRNEKTQMIRGVMEIVDYKAYDLKYLDDSDISYNPALGTGQIQIRDIHQVGYKERSSEEICELLDKKCIASKKGFEQWYVYAKQYGWINEEY